MAEEPKYLVDAYPVPDTYVESLGRVELTGNNVRLTFATSRAKDGGDVDHEVIERIVMPLEAVIPALHKLLRLSREAKMLDTFKGDANMAHYAGKTYEGSKATEIVSMGLEMLYRDPAHFAKADPQYFSLMMGILQRKGK